MPRIIMKGSLLGILMTTLLWGGVACAADTTTVPADSPDATPTTTTIAPESSSPSSNSDAMPITAKTGPGSKPVFSLNADTEALKLTNDLTVAKDQVDKHPGDPEAHFLLAAAYSRSPYLDQALTELRKVKEILKERQDFEFIDKTIGQYEDLLNASPNNTIVLYRLAMAYYLKGYSIQRYGKQYKNIPTGEPTAFYQKAQDTLQKVITIDPKDIYARDYLGYMVADNGKDLAKGIPIWEASLAVNKDQNPGAYLLLSQAYLKQGNLTKAISYGAKGLEIKQSMGMNLP